MDLIAQITLALVLSLILSLGTYKFGMLTKGGMIASFATGSFVGIFGTVEWLILLIIFTLAGLLATKINFEQKVKKDLQEGKHGERTYMNILGVGLPPCIIAFVSWMLDGNYQFESTVAFVSTLTVAAADTIASEIGVKDPRVWLITTLKRTVPGVNGGISLLGTATSSIVSVIVAILGWLLIYQTLNIYVLIPAVAGIFGNLMDSLLGATLEEKGYISKYANNSITALMGALFGVVLCILIL